MTGPADNAQRTPVSAIADASDGPRRRERGISTFAKIFDLPEQDVPTAFAARVGLIFAEEALQATGGAASSHPALTDRERSIAVITALTAQGVSGDRLSTHVDLGRQQGLDEKALTALMTLLANYLGYPRAGLAMEAIHATFTSADRSGTTN